MRISDWSSDVCSSDLKFAGATTNGWRAFNISADKETGIGGWTDEALASYLSTGFADGHGVATGPMGEAVDLGLRHLTPDDIRALVVYLRSVPPVTGDDPPRDRKSTRLNSSH